MKFDFAVKWTFVAENHVLLKEIKPCIAEGNSRAIKTFGVSTYKLLPYDQNQWNLKEKKKKVNILQIQVIILIYLINI